jgi:hypothetical protein
MRLTPLLFVLLVVVALGLLSLAALDSFAPASCSDPKASLDAGLTTNADKAYRAILADEPDSKCAISGVRAIARRRCAAADRLRLAGAADEAKKQYDALLSMEVPHLPVKPRQQPAPVSSDAQRRAADPILCGATGLKALEAAAAKAKAAEQSAATKAPAG